MFTIQGPYPTLPRTIVLPSPQLLDNTILPVSINWKQAIDGTNYTYGVLNRTVERLLTYNFDFVQYDKLIELFEFYNYSIMIAGQLRQISTSELRITDHENVRYRVRMVMPEMTVNVLRRAKAKCNVIHESGSFILNFRGYKL